MQQFSLVSVLILGLTLAASDFANGGILDDLKETLEAQVRTSRDNKALCDARAAPFSPTRKGVLSAQTNVYKGPNSICGRVGLNKAKTSVKVLGQRGTWYYIEATNRRGQKVHGWVPKSRVGLQTIDTPARREPPTDRSVRKGYPTYPRPLVADVQRLLNEHNYDAGQVDGLYGSKTKAAIWAFQTDSRLPATGEPDPNTLKALKATDATRIASPGDSDAARLSTPAASGCARIHHGSTLPLQSCDQIKYGRLWVNAGEEKCGFALTPQGVLKFNGRGSTDLFAVPNSSGTPNLATQAVVFSNGSPGGRFYVVEARRPDAGMARYIFDTAALRLFKVSMGEPPVDDWGWSEDERYLVYYYSDEGWSYVQAIGMPATLGIRHEFAKPRIPLAEGRYVFLWRDKRTFDLVFRIGGDGSYDPCKGGNDTSIGTFLITGNKIIPAR